ncbi:hypothetical protein MTR_8g027515 [Medicago truncatula]|uniref:Uncharacterized protein n=1 Tax=Medicago truncatula TaxID=3880 RepID=A0A072TYK8_MEDTR|nr:hypothetical protein MTR_8g027515 [Medicago truncatula]
MGCKIARLKTWGAKSHNWQKIGVKSAIKPCFFYKHDTDYLAAKNISNAIPYTVFEALITCSYFLAHWRNDVDATLENRTSRTRENRNCGDHKKTS